MWLRSPPRLRVSTRTLAAFSRQFQRTMSTGGTETGSPSSASAPKQSKSQVREPTQKIKYPKRFFSGIQPTGQIHIGNYFGAIRQWVDLQEAKCCGEYDESIFCVVDLHAITLPQEPRKLRRMILEATATLVACGIDPDKSVLFLQSHVPQHCQMSCVLGCHTTVPYLNRLPAFKEKSAKLKEVPLGLFTYPVLQTADVLTYNATHVPVGEDNIQHIQAAHHTAKRFNGIYGEIFALPEALVTAGLQSRIRSLRNPEAKMSKSEVDVKSRICVQDDPDVIVRNLKKAVTDFTSEVTYEPETRLGVSNLVQIHALCTGQTVEQVIVFSKHLDTGKYKLVVAEALIEHLKTIRKVFTELMQDEQQIVEILKIGRDKAEFIAEAQWDLVCDAVGISPSLNVLDSGKNYIGSSSRA